jgi:tetratricopeptide (TPR) repeat protein
MIRLALSCAFVLAGAGASGSWAQTPALLDQGYRQMYNLQFEEAHRTFRAWQQQHPDDPMGPVSDAAAYLFAEFDRLHILQSEFFTHDQHFITDHKLKPDPEAKKQFEAALEKTRRLASIHPQDKNSQFAFILQTGLHSDWLALIEKKYGSSLQEMKAGRVAAERLLAQDPGFYDAWLAVGVENYMLSVKPAPLRWVLRMTGAQTNKALGLEKLRLTAEKGHYLAPFARLLLAVAALRENDLSKAREILAGLTREFPDNPLYRQELARLEIRNANGGR